MKNQIRKTLGRLACVEYQRLFCIGGTKSEYVLPDELLESTANTVQTVLASPVLSKGLAVSELNSLREFLEVVNASASEIPFGSDAVSNEELIERNPAWNTVRVSAQKCLDALGLKASLDELLSGS